ncbi:MAG TPA: YegP family protein [Bacteroidales bacterium]|jgi:uncharacterized protein YegP (UPF0339 family)|nr:YegP family protein [Bacteroidales bacterium]
MGKFVVTTRKNGEFQFNLVAGNGQVILSSEGYSTKAACLNGVESVKKNSQEMARFDKKTTESGAFRFNLKATNGQVIGVSQNYTTEAACNNGIESVMKNAPDAVISDETVV